ncbi:hypothetical protein MYSEV_086 [Mythimna separata entomopoxvirus 'L']|uniref:C2H2-type domain-containing protein n=1 Tax=Mythimna separata entomopoxvirus 'L' TaxID=1293572 RepID=A0A916KQ55_9POXV|nr:hypothetical protein MYSEV_086 [Mythimna separata entomopoxvirus 'L']CCU56284.1 hypothetical protein MYSEV_086 [Mythimna separata entomopoxvirus 'L']
MDTLYLIKIKKFDIKKIIKCNKCKIYFINKFALSKHLKTKAHRLNEWYNRYPLMHHLNLIKNNKYYILCVN